MDLRHLEILHARSVEDLADAKFTRRGMPFLRKFLQDLVSWGRLEEDRCGRAYQFELVSLGTLAATSPFTGTTIGLTHSLILRNHTVFFAFADVAPVFMIASFLGEGYPVTGALFPEHELLVQLGPQMEWGPRQEHVEMLADTVKFRHSPVAIATGERIVVTGDQNFAHCAWNQLCSLEVLVRSGLIDRVQHLMVTSEPLGRLDRLFPEIDSRRLQRLTHRQLELFNTGDKLLIPVGGVRVSKAVRNRVMTLAAESLTARGNELKNMIVGRRHLPTFWVSIRTRNRTASNQISFISELINALSSAFGACNIVLDGHSTPMDWQDNPDVGVAQIQQIIDGDQKEVDAILTASGLCGETVSETKVIPAVGLPILDSILLGQFADFYVCHHGTVQHKIGWFHPVPGVVHTNKAYLINPPGRWVASQSDCGVEPKYVGGEWITDLDRPESYRHYPAHMQLQNYRVDNIPAMVNFIVEQARAALQR